MNRLDELISLVHKGEPVDADEILNLAGLPDKFDQSIGFVAQAVYFHDHELDLDRSMLDPDGDPADYLIPQAPEFFRRVGRKRTLEIMKGGTIRADEQVSYRASRGWGMWQEGDGHDLLLYETVGTKASIYVVVGPSGFAWSYEASHSPTFLTSDKVDTWARKLPNFYGWFPFGGGNLKDMIASVRNPRAYRLKGSSASPTRRRVPSPAR
jgi:hypothetical protein